LENSQSIDIKSDLAFFYLKLRATSYGKRKAKGEGDLGLGFRVKGDLEISMTKGKANSQIF
jgi:hypothetical protein